MAPSVHIAVPSPFVLPVARKTRTVNDCVFCEIVADRTPADVVYCDEEVIAFLDRSPVFKGHVLVVPTTHVGTLLDMPASALGTYFAVVQRVVAAVQGALDAHGSFVAINNVVSQSVPHLHVHVVPRRRKDGLRGFFWPRVRYADALESGAIAALIREFLSS